MPESPDQPPTPSSSSPPTTELLRSILRSRRRHLAAASSLFVSHQVGELLVPVVAGVVIDRAVATGDGAAVVRWLIVLALVFAVLSTSWRWADRLLTRSVEESAHELRMRITARVTDPRGFAEAMPAGQVVSVATSDANATAEIQTATAFAIAGLAAILTSAIVLLWISIPLGLVVLIGLPPVLAVLHVLVAPIERRFSAQQADVASAASTATDLLAGLRVLKGLHAEGEATERYRRASRRSLAAGLRASRLYAAHNGLTVAVTGIFVAVVALVGGRLAADGRISIGELVAAVGVTQFLVGPLSRVGWAAATRATARASAARVVTVLDAAGAVTDGTLGIDAAADGTLRFRDVSFATLADFDLTVPAGHFVGIAVADAADAAAIVTLLGRGADPSRGDLDLGGATFATFRLDDLRRTVLVADHEARLFTGTTRDNLLATTNATEIQPAELALVLAASGADEVVDALPLGLDAPVTERGRSLSGGQRQRIALARALAADPPVLVLHDPTTAVDAVTEARIADGLRDRRSGRTTIVVATSPALLAVADEVFLVDGGQVIDAGRHAELVTRSPRYVAAVLS